jgi:hypothetical protein
LTAIPDPVIVTAILFSHREQSQKPIQSLSSFFTDSSAELEPELVGKKKIRPSPGRQNVALRQP